MNADHLYDAWSERAAIRQWDGGAGIDQAEADAWEDVLRLWNPAQTTLEGT